MYKMTKYDPALVWYVVVELETFLSKQVEVILMQLVSNLRISKRIPSELERPTMLSAVSYLKGKEKMYGYKRRGFTRLKEGTEIYREKDEVPDQKLLNQSSSAQSYNP